MSQHQEPQDQIAQQKRFTDTVLSVAYNAELSRRQAFRAALATAGAAVLLGQPSLAFAAKASQETLDALEEAEEELAEVEEQLEELADEFEELSAEQDETIADIEAVQEDIDEVEADIEAKEEEIEAKEAEIAVRQGELEEKQEALGARISSDYKNGGTNLLTLLISSSSFEELLANMHYADKINESDQAAIEEIQVIQQELEEQKAELEEQKEELEATKAELEEQQAALEELKEEQTEQLEEMKATQAEVAELVESLSDEVKELMEQRDEEYLAAVAEEEAQAAAEAAASSSSSSSSSSTSVPANAQALVVSCCKSVASPGAGYCARWVSLVFQKAGFKYYGGNACDMYNSWCTSSNRSYLQTAMIIAVSSHTHTSAGRIYGHVGIYVGSSTVMDNVGYIRSIGVDSWISYFGTTVTPRWGWIGGVDLSES